MIPAKMNPISISTKRGKGVDSIVDWFDEYKQTFYSLGWSYLRNQQQMEELFYTSIIKVQKEMPRFKSETSFETWVTSIFIPICRELYAHQGLQHTEESEQRQDVLIALDQLKEYEKEAILLTYVKRMSKEEAAHLLKVSAEEMQELLFSGIQSLRKEMRYGSTFNGCKEYHKKYIDYLERAMCRPEKVDFEVHIYHCQECQEDLAAFQDVMLTMTSLTDRIEDLQMPSGFMESVKDRLAEKERQRQQKKEKRNRMGLVLSGFIALGMGIGFFTGVFSSLYYSWTEDNKQLRTFLQQDLGKRLNLEAESNGVKITIKSAIADDVQTLVFYEIEDKDENNQYVINYDEGILVENQQDIMNNATYPRYYPPDFESDGNNKQKNVFEGKISLLPLAVDDGTIKLKITKLQKLVRDSTDPERFENIEFKTGEWNFEIPVSKQPSIEYALDEETEVEGIPVRFNKLTIAPTATILQFGINNEQPEKRLEVLSFDNLEVNDKKLKADRWYGTTFSDVQKDMNWTAFHTHFDPLFGEKPNDVNVQFASARLTFEDPKTIELDASRDYPQTFEYAGSTISIDSVEAGPPSEVVISNHDIEDRAYQSLHFDIMGDDESENSSIEMDSEGVLVDKNGIEYDLNITPVSYEKIEQPRYFETVQRITLHGSKVGPKRLNIIGYSAMKYVDDVVNISTADIKQ
ncbi:DUF4179 domain-containing protein [Mesobacillus foraminis]|uniref:DUF4179 domain-containing protein n=1 Tax=Mesobacillus foraminis TaxID=279826 RepID=UPI001BE61DE8|nr:DUF4179 domain-containing protein [Mesobacillus foraminis]MBT2758479.1 DUF4179 domain-containing protein [Mesobacillus foraminis]